VLRPSIEWIRERTASVHGEGERVRAVLRLEDEHGRIGSGEAAPLPDFSPDTMAEVARDLGRQPWNRVSLDGDVLDSLEGLDVASPAARFAVETALLDLASQARGVRIVDLLGGPRTERLSLARVARPTDTIDAEGVTAIKLKIGRDAIEREIEGARAIRAVLGPDVAIRLDANRKLSGREAERFAPIVPELVEEPSDFGGLTLPVALDESLVRPDAIEYLSELVELAIVRFVVLKPTTLGLMRALEIARVAERLGAGVIVSHTVEGPIGYLACVHLAFACMNGTLAAGLHPHEGLDRTRLVPFERSSLLAPTGTSLEAEIAP
jgi:L-alanine-DL-glutamate epimerase-like enolase superfamily enzyme